MRLGIAGIGLGSALLLGAHGGATAQQRQDGDPHAAMPMAGHNHEAAAKDPAGEAYMAAMSKMHQAMPTEPTGDPDVDFVRGMLPHHQGAVDMAEVELRHGKDPELRRLAQDVVDAQKKEIGLMHEWMKKHER